MAKIGITDGGSPQTGKLYSFANMEDANTSPDLYTEDPVFGSAEHLRDYYAKSDIQIFSRRFCARIITFDDLWVEIQRRAVPGRYGKTQPSRNGIMSENIESDAPEAAEPVAKARKPRVKKEKVPAPSKANLDRFGLRAGSKSSEIAEFLTQGRTMTEVKETFGDVHYNLVKRLGEMGHTIEKEGAKLTLIHNPDYVRPKRQSKEEGTAQAAE